MDRSRQIGSHAGLRGVAALLVVAYHFQFGGSYHLAIEDATPLFQHSYLFVDLFFVLSGFILSYINEADRHDIVSHGQYRRFLIRRIVRLYPLLFCTLLFLIVERGIYSAILSAAGKPPRIDWGADSLAVLASQFLLVNAWNPGPAGWNVPSWSISAEMVAYVLFPLIVGAWLRRPWLTRLVLAMIAIGFYARVSMTSGSLDIVGGWAPLRCLAGFSTGMLLYAIRHRAALLPPLWLGLAQLGCVAGIVAILMSDIVDPAVIPLFAVLVLSTWTDGGLVARMLASRVFTYLGEISYSVYLTHVCLIEVIDVLWRGPQIDMWLGLDGARLAFILLGYAVVLAVSHLTFLRIEVPARRWLGEALLHRRMGPDRKVAAGALTFTSLQLSTLKRTA